MEFLLMLAVLLFFGLPYLLILRLFSRLSDVEGRLRSVELRPWDQPAPAPVSVPPPRPPTPKPVAIPVRVPTPEYVPPKPPPPPPQPATEQIASEQITAKLDRMAESTGGWEALIGGNLLNKLGAFVLVIGIALFLSFSFSNMGPAGRALTAAAVSLATLAGGIFTETKERYKVFARGIIAAGWAGLYFTAYAMYALPAAQVIDSPIVGTLLMIAVAVAMVGHSLRYRVESLTALAFGCIYGALALSPMNTFAAVSLIPLAAAMLYLARRFDWHALALFAAGGTYAVFLTRPATGAPLANIQFMLVIFWAMFEGFDLLRLRSGTVASPLYKGLFALNAVAGLAASAALWNRMAPESMWQFAAGAAVLYLASAWVRFALEGETYYEFSLILSSILTGLAIFARVPGLWESLGLILEAEVLFLAAHFIRVRAAKVLSWLAFFAATIHWNGSTTTILGAFEVYNFTPPLVIMAGLFYLNRFLSKEETYWSYFAAAFIAVVAAAETPNDRGIGIVLLAWTVLLFEFGLRTRLREFRIQSYVLAPCAAFASLGMLFDQPWNWSFAVFAVILYLQTLRATRGLPSLFDSEHKLLRLAGSIGATLFTGVYLHQTIRAPWEPVAFAVLAMLTLEAGLALRMIEWVWLGRAVSAISAVMLLFHVPSEMNTRIALAAAIAAAQLVIRFRARPQPLSAAHGLLAAFVIAATLWNEVSGRMLTLSWSAEAIALLALGFAARDRVLRLNGLGMLLGCILKVFLYDLRNLPTEARILSFIGLGVILLAVSWIYTRFKEQLSKLL